MLTSSNESFLKKNYPFILIAVGFFFILFPFDLIGVSNLGDMAVVFYGLIAVLPIGFVLYYKKRNQYSLRTRKIIKISALAIPLFFVAAVFIGIAMGVNNAFLIMSLEPTTDFDTDLLETEIIDWVNINRVQNEVGGVNLDESLNDLAEIRSSELIQASAKDRESIAEIDINEISKREGIECVIDGKPSNIYDYVLVMPPKSYPDIKRTVDHIMTELVDNKEFRDIVFLTNATKTGMDSFVAEDNVFVVQNFC